MGVNLPAHLVIIKATQQYIGGSYKDYTDTQILQMIGRAGRPQFDTSAVAIIMTKETHRYYYFLQCLWIAIAIGNQPCQIELVYNILENDSAFVIREGPASSSDCW